MNEEQQPIYSLNNKVKVLNGFYKNFKGKIKDYKVTKQGIEYEVEVNLKDNRVKKINFAEIQLKKTFF